MLNIKAEIRNTIFLIILVFNFLQISIEQVVQMDPTIVPKFQTEIKNLEIAQSFSSGYYIIQASKKQVKILPDSMNLTTQMYVFSSLGADGTQIDSGKIIVEQNQSVSVTWINNIDGLSILPIDTTLDSSIPAQLYTTQVPMIIHLHGLTSISGYDGRPQGYFTKSGKHGPTYVSNTSFMNNSATFVYENKNIFGYYYFHDHTLSITRTNVISGLKGVYQIKSTNYTQEQQQIKYAFGDMETLELLIYDTKLQENGSIYYHDPSQVVNYVWWIPQYFGDVMVVNGKAWPFWNVQKKLYRLAILNACNSRFLNLYFQDSLGNNISFYVIKKDSGYVNRPVMKQQDGLVSPFGRMELIIDFTQAAGDVVMRNNAQTPLLVGDPVVPDLDGQIMKFAINATNSSNTSTFSNLTKNYSLGQPYPKYSTGTILPLMIIELDDQDDNPLKMLFNGQNMLNGKMCENRVFQRGQIYDLYIFNPTDDEHPIHIHLVTHQVIGRYQISKIDYKAAFKRINGQIPLEGFSFCTQFPKIQNYLIGEMIPPLDEQMSLSDVANAPPGYMTIVRLAMSDQNQVILDQKFNGIYPIHCHMLQHEDNNLMTYFYLVTQKVYVQSNLNSVSSSNDVTPIREVYDGAAIKTSTSSSSFSNNNYIFIVYFLSGILFTLFVILLLLLYQYYCSSHKQVKKNKLKIQQNSMNELQDTQKQPNQKQQIENSPKNQLANTCLSQEKQ